MDTVNSNQWNDGFYYVIDAGSHNEDSLFNTLIRYEEVFGLNPLEFDIKRALIMSITQGMADGVIIAEFDLGHDVAIGDYLQAKERSYQRELIAKAV